MLYYVILELNTAWEYSLRILNFLTAELTSIHTTPIWCRLLHNDTQGEFAIIFTGYLGLT